MTAQELKNFIRATLVAQRSIAQEYNAFDAVIDFITQSITNGIPDWTNLLEFNTDGTGSGAFCTEPDNDGNLRFWRTKVDDNVGHQPPTDPDINEDSYWEEVSPASGSSIKEWETGIYGDGLVIVFYNGKLYKLSEPVRPFTSVNIDAEIAQGKWLALNADSIVYLYQSLNDVATIDLDLANKTTSVSKLETNRTAVTINITSLPKGTRHAVLVKKLAAGDLVITPNFNSYAVNVVGEAAAGSTVTLKGAAGKVFLLELYSLAQTAGLTLVNNALAVSNPGALHAIDANTIIVGGNGKIRRSLNAGVSFADEFTGTSFSFVDIHFFNTTNGVAIVNEFLSGSKVWYTTNGGDTWTASSTAPEKIRAVWMASATVAYAVGDNPSFSIYKSTDGGATWTLAAIPELYLDLYEDVTSVGTNNVFVCGRYRRIWKSTNGGTSWTDIRTNSVPSGHTWRALAFADANTGFVGGDNGILFNTLDGGASWSPMPVPAVVGTIEAIALVGAATKVIVVGSGGLAYSSDGGTTWTLNTSITNFKKVSVVDESNIYLLASTGGLYRYVVAVGSQVLFAVDGSGNGYTQSEADGLFEKVANKGVANGYASLDSGGKVPSAQLPSYVDDVLEYANLATFPGAGETGKIYVAIDTNLSYRWSGSAYVLISSVPADASETVKGIAELANQAESEAVASASLATDADHSRILTGRGLWWWWAVVDLYSKVQNFFINWLYGIETRSSGETAYGLSNSHAGKIVRFTSDNTVTVTIPPDETINAPIGSRWILRRTGNGVVNIVAGSGVTINSPDGFLSIRGKRQETIIVKTDLNTYSLLAPVFNRHVIMVTDYGAIGDGVFDNYSIIQALIAAFPGKRIIVPSEGTFLVSKPLTPVANTLLNVYGELIIEAANIRDLTANASIGQSQLSVANADQYFKAGQWIAISDNNKAVNGGGAWKTRKVADGNYITSVTSTQINLRTPLISNFTTAASAKVGQAQSVILVDGVNNVKILGSGTINGNRANQFNVAPLHESGIAEGESVRQHCGISAHTVTNLEIDGVRVINSALHGVSLKNVSNASLRRFHIENTMDKSILGFNLTDAEISSGKILTSVDEDGVSMYGGNSRVLISNVRAEGCRRYGFTVIGTAGLNTNTDIRFVNIQSHNCYCGLYIQNASKGAVSVAGFTATGNHPTEQINPVIVTNCQGLTLYDINVNGVIPSSAIIISVSNLSARIKMIGGSVSNCTGKSAFSTDCQDVVFDSFTVNNCGSVINSATSTTVVKNSHFNTISSMYGNGTTPTLAKFKNCKTDLAGTSFSNASRTTIKSGQTYMDVQHFLSYTPPIEAIFVTPVNNLGNATKWWISNVTKNTFRINVDVDPGATTAKFAWLVSDNFEQSVLSEISYTTSYASNFSAGTDGFAGTNGVLSGNNDGIGGENDVLRFYADAVNGNHQISKAMAQVGSINRIRFRYRIPSGQTKVNGFRVYDSAFNLILEELSGGTVLYDQWVSVVTKEFTPSGSTVYIRQMNTFNISFAGANSASDDILDLKDTVCEYR